MLALFSPLSWLLPLMVSLLTGSCQQEGSQIPKVHGIYGNPKPIWDKGYQLSELNINAIFVHSGSINQEMITRARAEGVKIYAEFATLNGKNYVEQHPEAWAINNEGQKVEAASWFMGVCPNEPGFRQYRRHQLEELLQQFDLDGVWLDYLHWHAQFEDPEPILPETCFCEHCTTKFSQTTNITLPKGSLKEVASWILTNQEDRWRTWRCQILFEWTNEMRSIVKSMKPTALLGLYHCPWTDAEFQGARQRILGLDYDLLRQSIDVFSPMVYHERMGREPEWVEENLTWFYQKLQIKSGSPQVWPIVQAHNDPGMITAVDFKTVLEAGLKSPSGGAMMFTTNAVAEDPEKIEVVKAVYGKK